MEIFGIIILSVVAYLAYILTKPLALRLHLPQTVIYIILGAVFGTGGLALLNSQFYIIANLNVFPSWKIYSMAALYLLFFGSGYNIEITRTQKTTKNEFKLMTIPVYSELIIMSIVGYFLLNIITEVTYVEAAVIAILFAMASSANVVNTTTANHLKFGRHGDKNIGPSIVKASILDNITPLPLVLLLLPILRNGTFDFFKLASELIEFSIIIILAIVLAKVIQLLFIGIAKRIKRSKMEPIYYATFSFLILLLTFYLATLIKNGQGVLEVFGFAVAMIVGIFLAKFDRQNIERDISLTLNKIFNIFGLPIIALGVGANVNFKEFADLKVMSVGILFILCAVAIKLTVTYFLLKRENYNNGAIKYSMSAFLAKGAALINLSVLLIGITPDSPHIMKLITIIATFGIVLTIPLAVTLMQFGGKRWLKTEVNEEFE